MKFVWHYILKREIMRESGIVFILVCKK